MLTSAIIARYNLAVDDASELSSSEELALANEVYVEIANDRPWEWTKATAVGTTSTTLPYIALELNFKALSPNKDMKSVVFVGTDFAEYQVIPFSSRREYRNQDGICYIDIPNKRLYFTLQPTAAKTVEYDYIKIPADLTASAEPLVTTAQFGNLIAYGMAAKFSNIEQVDKSKGPSNYQRENQIEYARLLSDEAMEDAHVKLSII